MMSSRGKRGDAPSKTHSKIIGMYFFILCDLTMNMLMDYDEVTLELQNNMHLGFVGLQVVVEICIFLILFLATADTFVFRVGLLGVLLQAIQSTLILHPIYVVLTLVTGLRRVRHFNDGNGLNELWHDSTFFGLTVVHKMTAIVYYVMNIRSARKLEDPIFFNKDAWIELMKKQKRSFGEGIE
jgi:hypothetical protein